MPDTFFASIRAEFAEIQNTILDPNLYTFNKTPANVDRPAEWYARMQGNVLDKVHKKNRSKTHSDGFAIRQVLNLNPSPKQACNAHAEMA